MPYLLKYNHFEDLLEIVNLVISMHYASMTVWQSLSSKTPTIGYNYCNEDKVYFDNFPYFIAGKNKIGDEGAAKIGEALRELKMLTNLNLNLQ